MRALFDTVEEYWNWDDVEYAASKASDDSVLQFRAMFASRLGVEDPRLVELIPSARYGLELFLKENLAHRRTVLVPRFNCSVVQESIENARAVVELYDFSPIPGMFDWEDIIQQVGSETGAIVVTHYFGVPVDFRPILNFCIENQIILIEDCAHTLRGKIGGRYAGTIGDAALFSFNYDKPVSLGWGGALLVNNAFYQVSMSQQNISVPTVNQEITLLKNFTRAMEERRTAIPREPRFSERVFRQLGLRKINPFVIDANMGVGAVQAELGMQCMARYDSVLQSRIHNAEQIAEHCPNRTWPVGSEITPAWLKQKVRFPDQETLSKSANNLQKKGIRAGNFNWPVLLTDQSSEAGASSLDAANIWMDVPVHQNLDENALNTCIDGLNKQN